MDVFKMQENYDGSHKVQNYNKIFKEDVAIVGIAARFPKAENIKCFWDNLINNVDCIGEIPSQRRLDIERYLRFEKKWSDKITFSEMGYLESIDKFDYKFFKMSPMEANTMDPNQRIFLETVWKAIEDAGYGNGMLKRSRTGVYLGYNEEKFCNYLQMVYDVAPAQLQSALAGNLSPVIASRIAYILDLHGPNMIINTACSSSLVAVQLACQSLLSNESDMAIAGGINVRLMPVHIDGSLIESPDGRTRTFDNSSAGTSVGEASAALVLKLLSKAEKDKDKIYAVIKGGAVTQDGSSIGITAPNADAQCMSIQAAWENSGIDPETISYIEAHGTATRLGDPIEIDAIERAFGKYTRKKQFCGIGSVKSNIGHTDSVSGLAGIIKTVLMLQNRRIPATLHFREPNSEIRFHDSPVYITDELSDWKADNLPRRAGVSSFGLSGTNCHIILEEYINESESQNGDINEPCIFTLSAQTTGGLHCLISEYLEMLENDQGFSYMNICKTANTARGHFDKRMAFLVHSRQALVEKLCLLSKLDSFEGRGKRGIYYNEHHIVSQLKPDRDPNEILRSTVRKLSGQAENKVEEVLINSNVEILNQIMELYVCGAEINWCKLYPMGSFTKVSLPTYPFEPIRCWLDIPEGGKEFYETVWLPSENSLKSLSGIPQQNILVFCDDSSFSQQLIGEYKSTGHTVITVKYGDGYKRINEQNYTVASDPIGYRLLMEDLDLRGLCKIVQIASAISKNKDCRNEFAIDNRAAEVLRLFNLTQSLLETKGGNPVELFLVLQMGVQVLPADFVHAEYAAAIGFCKIISKEYANISVRCIDTDHNTSFCRIIDETFCGEGFMAAYRNNVRYREAIKKKEIFDFKLVQSPVRDGGVYIITGGLGGIGLSLARYLAEKKSTTLILVNRTPFADRNVWEEILTGSVDEKICAKIKAIREIERLNSKVVCISADVSDFESMNGLIQDIRNRFGKINGVIHTAGVGGNGFIYNKTESQLLETMSGKIMGAVILDKLTEQDNLDFFILFSAISSLAGMPGQSDYVAANAFVDSFAAMRNLSGKHTLCINWPAWSETGLVIDFNVDISQAVFKPLKTKEALSYFDFLLKSDAKRVIVGEVDKNYFNLEAKGNIFWLNDFDLFQPENQVSDETSQTGNRSSKEINITGKTAVSYTSTEIKLAQIWGEVFYLNTVDIFSNFYEIGGNSIYAMKLVNRIHNEFHIDLNILEFMSHLTIAELAVCIDNKSKVKIVPQIEKASADIRTNYPASSIQKRLYALQLLEPENMAYHVVLAYRLQGALNIPQIEKAIYLLIKRHESLRTSLRVINGKVVQCIESENDIELPLECFRVSGEKLSQTIQAWQKPYRLEQAPLFRIGVFTATEQESVLVFDLHHVIADDISVQNIVRDLFLYYLHKGDGLPGLIYQYKDYVLLQEEKQDYPAPVKKYWEKVLQQPLAKTIIPYDYPDEKDFRGQRRNFSAQKSVFQRMKWLTIKNETTSFMFLLTVFFIVLHKYTNKKDLIIGVPVSGRNHMEFENTVGAFIKTLPIRVSISEEQPFENLLAEIKQCMQQAFAYQDYPLDEMILDKNMPYDYYNHPLYNILFVQHYLNRDFANERDINVEVIELENKTSKFDFSLESLIQEEECLFTVEYRTGLYSEVTVSRFIEHYLYVIDIVTSDPGVSILDIKFDTVPGKENTEIVESLFDFEF